MYFENIVTLSDALTVLRLSAFGGSLTLRRAHSVRLLRMDCQGGVEVSFYKNTTLFFRNGTRFSVFIFIFMFLN
jgi:hypothetical protein